LGENLIENQKTGEPFRMRAEGFFLAQERELYFPEIRESKETP
jgi:hypothetical protein